MSEAQPKRGAVEAPEASAEESQGAGRPRPAFEGDER